MASPPALVAAVHGATTLIAAGRFALAPPTSLADAEGALPLLLGAVAAVLTGTAVLLRGADVDAVQALRYREGATPGLMVGATTLPLLLLGKIAALPSTGSTLLVQYYLFLFAAMATASVVLLVTVLFVRAPFVRGPVIHILAVALPVAAVAWCCGLPVASMVGFEALFVIFLWLALTRLKDTFTLGEAMVLCHMLAALWFDALAHTVVIAFGVGPSFVRLERPMLFVIIQAVVLGILLVGFFVFPLLLELRASGRGSFHTGHWLTDWKSMSELHQLQTLLFFGILLFIVVGVVDAWLVMTTGVEAFSWTVYYVTSSARKLKLVGVWLLMLIVGVVAITPFADRLPNIVVRKMYHALAVAMFLPGMLYEPAFLSLAFCVAFAALVLVEYVRLGLIWPFGRDLDRFMKKFVDQRDAGTVVVTHLYLLLGCAMPLWFDRDHAGRGATLAAYAGILMVGVGDAMASLVGVYFGRHRWPGSRKTYEGTAAAVVSVVVFVWVTVEIAIAVPIPAARALLESVHWPALGIATVLVCVLEAVTSQIDNVILPLHFFALLELMM